VPTDITCIMLLMRLKANGDSKETDLTSLITSDKETLTISSLSMTMIKLDNGSMRLIEATSMINSTRVN